MLTMLLKVHIDLERKQGKVIDPAKLAEEFQEFDEEFFRDLIQLPELPERARTAIQFPDRYEVIGKVGVGGIGIVYRVRDRQMQRELAIKTLNPRRRGNWVADLRLQQEAIITGTLQHPGIPPVYERGKLPDGGDYFSMKLVNGDTLDQILRREQQSGSQTELLEIFRMIAQTIGYAHAQGVIHRDLKPHNVMVGAFGEVQVMDWGMAKRIVDVNACRHQHEPEGHRPAAHDADRSRLPKPSQPTAALADGDAAMPDRIVPTGGAKHVPTPVESLLSLSTETGRDRLSGAGLGETGKSSVPFQTRQGDIAGTPSYMAPEQARGDRDQVGFPSDVFSLGAMLFEILLGEPLHSRSSAMETLSRVADGSYWQDVQERIQQAPVEPELAQICLRSLTPNPEDRFSDAGQLHRCINDYQSRLAERLKQAEIESSAANVRITEQRKRTWAVGWLSGVVAVVSLVGMLAFGSQWYFANQAVVRADRELDTRQEINEFVLDFFRQASPFEQPDRNLTVRQVLDRASSRMGNRFQDRPIVRAEILRQLAQSYAGLGEYQIALQHATEAHEILLAQRGDQPETWDAEASLAILEFQLGDQEKARKRLERLQVKLVKRFGNTDPKVLALQSSLSGVLASQGKLEQAERLIRGVVQQEAIQQAANPNSPPLPDPVANQIRLANTMIELGEYAEAQQRLMKILDVIERQVDVKAIGKQMPADDLGWAMNYLKAKSTLGLVYDLQHQFDEAEPLHFAAWSTAKELLGEGHSTTLGYAGNRINSLMKQDDLQTAKPLLLSAIKLSQSSLGEVHEQTTNLQNSLASLYLKSKDFAAAEKTFLELAATLDQKYVELHPDQVTNDNNLGSVYEGLGRLQDAKRLYEKALAGCRQIYGQEHPQTAITHANLAHLLEALGEFDEAEKQYLQSIEISEIVFTPHHADTLLTISGLSLCYMRQRKFEQAIPWLLRLREGNSQSLNRDESRIATAAAALGHALNQLKRYEEAVEPLLFAYEYRKRKYGAGSKKAVSQLMSLTRNWAAGGYHQELADFYERTVQEFKDAGMSGNRIVWLELQFRSRRARALIELNRLDEAAKELKEVFPEQEQIMGIDPAEKRRLLRSTASRLIKIYRIKEDETEVENWKAAYDRYRDPDK